MKNEKTSEKAGGINKSLRLDNSFLQKLLTRAFLLLAPVANKLDTSRFPIGCMIWQHAFILESICETNSIKFSFPLNGRVSLLLF